MLYPQQAKVNAMRYEIDEEQANKAIKAISKDVPRTDKGTYFTADEPHRLVWLNDILVTFAIFNKEVSRHSCKSLASHYLYLLSVPKRNREG